jgi:rhamnose transport system ATP-binding protein
MSTASGGDAVTARTESAPSVPEGDAPRLQMTDITKRYGAVRAIRHADLSVHAGRVLALVGENGAGKSTLIKILSGAVIADGGAIRYEGRRVSISSTSEAMALGIATVYQEPQLFGELTVSENIFLGREMQRRGRIDWVAQNAKVVELLALLDLPPRYATAVVGDLSIAEQQ